MPTLAGEARKSRNPNIGRMQRKSLKAEWI
jgi:hypothetical protein